MKKPPPQDDPTFEDEEPESHKVGPGRPPIHSRYKKGQSGNPGGRKKEAISYEAALRAILERCVGRNKDGDPITTLEALLHVLVKSGLGGSRRAIENMLDRIERLDRRRQAPQGDVDDAEEDESILNRAFRRRSNQLPDDEGSSKDGEDDIESGDDEESGDD